MHVLCRNMIMAEHLLAMDKEKVRRSLIAPWLILFREATTCTAALLLWPSCQVEDMRHQEILTKEMNLHRLTGNTTEVSCFSVWLCLSGMGCICSS